ncbi:DUF7409 domain-containing protein [Halobacterium zhouii]|uniref:DUF7409 domain-containing protein n=1 Tax=Halobacterium zhouii TaxID=2902624 RepID=UPI001E5DEB9C|nr:hypothetical protein [Halobacterium zhouii]
MAQSDTRDALLALRHVGPATADALTDADVEASAIESKTVSHADLVAAGVNPGVAARIRREHSLQWSFEGGQDLGRRAEQVRGLHDDEREWVAASYGDDANASADGSGDAAAEEAAWRDRPISASDPESDAEAEWQRQSWPNEDENADRSEISWRERSKPTPVTALEGVADGDAKLLARAGITSVRSLETANVERTADSLDIPADLVEAWQCAARELDSYSDSSK